MSDFLSFRLRDEFIDGYRGREPEWGFPIGAGNTLGHHSFITKYSRRKDDGTRERFHEAIERVINGTFTIQKNHALEYRLPWNEEQAHRSAEEAYERLWAGKWSPPGRGLWCMGSEFVHTRKDGGALNNCGFISTESDDPVYPYPRAMEMLMLGIGVGFDTRGSGKTVLHSPRERFPHVIADSREGWCESVGTLLRAFLQGNRLPVFDYSRIRLAGEPIRGFGGSASGPAPLKKLHEQLISVLKDREGEVLTSTDIVDIVNLIGKCVVAGNVRRSAEVALGMPDDEDFLELKNWEKNPVRMGADGWGHLSNNSVIAQSGGDYSHLAKRIALNGEPGIYWLDIVQDYGRLADPPDHKEYRTTGGNPCMEQPLENNEICCLVETYPTNCDDLADYLRTLKFAYLYAKTVTLLMSPWPETNEVVIRNRRIGTSMSGIAQFAETRGWSELRRWQEAGYQEVRRWDRVYSEWLGVRESIRVTTVKPSGTVSLLFGVTPGVHWPRERGFYVRTVRDMTGSPFAKAMAEAGYPVEPSVMDPESTVVITMPAEGPDIRPEREVTAWEKTSLAALCQRYWSDNAVSCTITFSQAEAEDIPAILRTYDGQLKTVSFLPIAEGTYQQAPYQRVSREYWEELRSRIKPLDWDSLYGNPELAEAEGENYCTTDTCEVPR